MTRPRITPIFKSLPLTWAIRPRASSNGCSEIKFEPYYGALKGALGTLQSKAGGATDTASLTIALLRASNIPARYVKGDIYVGDNSALGANGRGPRWIGAKSYQAAASILATGRNPNASYGNQGIYLTHVWVEACVPYGDYRGIGVDLSGHRWAPLDASFKDKTYQTGIALDAGFDSITPATSHRDSTPKAATCFPKKSTKTK